jgi:hypothetical protein
MNDWAKEAARRLRAAEQVRKQREQDSEEDLRILKFHTPRLWIKLKDSIPSNCQSLAVETGRPVIETSRSPRSGLRVKRLVPPAVLAVDFAEDPYRVSYSCGGGRGEYRISVDANGSASFRDAYHRWFTVEEVSRNLLDLLLQAPF